ncbi:unnamed protein product, partial [Hymenolepis diminuta]
QCSVIATHFGDPLHFTYTVRGTLSASIHLNCDQLLSHFINGDCMRRFPEDIIHAES